MHNARNLGRAVPVLTYSMNSLIRSLVTAVLIAASVFAFTYGVCGGRYSRTVVGPAAYAEPRKIVHSGSKRFRLRNEDGSVVVKTHPENTIKISADIRVYARERDKDELARKYGETLIAHEGNEDSFEVVTEPMERPDELDVLVEYEVFVPEGTDVEIESASGNVLVGNGCGAVTVAGRNMDISISKPRGKVVAQSTNGRIRILDAIQDASATTINGSVFAHMLGGALKAQTTNGDIVAHVLNPNVNLCDLATRNGGITLALSEGCSADLDARTTRGTVTSDFQVASETGMAGRRHLNGKIGIGKTSLQMSTLNGNIWITRNGL
jgi:hypothetical protein